MGKLQKIIDDPAASSCPLIDYDFAKIINPISYAFKPIVDFESGVVFGYEALFQNLDGKSYKNTTKIYNDAQAQGYLANLVTALFTSTLRSYCNFKKARGTKLFFNLDHRGLGNGNDPRMQLADIANSQGFSPSEICLEITLRQEDDCSDISQHALSELRRSGFLLALDNFGQGFSELRMIQEIEPEYIKIDRFFLSGIDSDPRRKLFVTTVANLAHVLGSRVIANGVESQVELKACHEAGCDLVQGPYVAKPVSKKAQPRLFYEHIRTPSIGNIQIAEELRFQAELDSLPTISQQACLGQLLDLFLNNQDTSIVPVLGANNEPRGLIHERDLKAYLYAGGLAQGEDNATRNLPILNLIRSGPIGDIDSNTDMLLKTFASSLNSDGIIITQNFRYVGFLSATSLLKIIHEKRLLEAQDQNPLTGLPGNVAITRFITEAAHPEPNARHLCYFDFDNFKPFNDTYGYRKGDRAIILFSELLQRHISGNGTFKGHVGGDDFFAGFLNGDRTEIIAVLQSLKDAFKSDVKSFYNAAHRECGYMEAADRFGARRIFPLLDCSISMITLEPDVGLHPEQMNAEIANLKKAAKLSDNGLVVKTIRS
ncbi:GGDEF domain-containing protein [Roseibium algae]|uniref:GGDEF domain-containing protein n=1 Tax=Roseibium algae TaxID=3123038 RepID=A0ABU8TMQ4_9HYPH